MNISADAWTRRKPEAYRAFYNPPLEANSLKYTREIIINTFP